MTDQIANIRAVMRSLASRFGCLDAVAETIAARIGRSVSKSTISQKLNGSLDWTLTDMIALEDAMGAHPVTRLIARRLNDQPEAAAENLLNAGADVAKESGEAIAAILAAQASAGSLENARAVCEIDEAIEALTRARACIERRAARDGGAA